MSIIKDMFDAACLCALFFFVFAPVCIGIMLAAGITWHWVFTQITEMI